MLRVISTGLFIALVAASLCWGQTGTVTPRALTLDECLKLAEKHNATLIAARENHNIAKSDVWTAWGRILPKLDSQVGYLRRISGPTTTEYLDTLTERWIELPVGMYVDHDYSAQLSAAQSWSLGGYDYYSVKEKYASRN